jgi:membrane fusion protein, multidrug efflux system
VHKTSILLAGAALVLCACSRQQAQPKQAMAGGPPVTPVSAAKAVQESVPTELHVVGTVDASAIVQVKSQIGGELVRVGFTEGQNIERGALLFEIDPRPYEEALRQAEAAVTRDRAQVAQAEADLARDTAQAKYAETDAVRQEQLHKESLASRMQAEQARTTLDVSEATAKATRATIDTAQATLAADMAAVGRAKLDLSYCQLRAPISGRTGNLLVHAGNLVKANDVPLVVIHQLSPIFVNFSVPEEHLAAIRRLSASHKLAVRVTSQDDPGRGASGQLVVIDNIVDVNTGTIHLKASFDNRNGMLWPGQFVTAILTLDTIHNATIVPAEAVQAGQRGPFVYTVTAKNTVEMRPVVVGATLGNRTVVEKGVAPGDTVVTDGQLRLFPGAPVRLVDPAAIGTGPL